MNHIKISVIIPVYNKKDYIRRTIESVRKQTYQNWELILIDDGSTDGSKIICDEYKDMDSRIIVKHNKNAGVCSARNTGIQMATGSYLSFIDADDFIDENAYEKTVDVIQTSNVDMVDWGWKYINNQNEISYNSHKNPKNILLDRDYMLKKVIPPLLNITQNKEYFIYDFVWNKVFKKSIIDIHGIRFDERRKKWEDRPFLVEFLAHADNMYCMDLAFYNYVGVEESLSRQYEPKIFSIILWNYELNYKLFQGIYNFQCDESVDYWYNSVKGNILEQFKYTEYQEEIITEIEKILVNPLVVSWYKNATPKTRQEKRIKQFIEEGEVSSAIQEYKKAATEKQHFLIGKKIWSKTHNKVMRR